MALLEVQLNRFQGPLDLLLHLITKAKIDVKDVFVSQITEQYLESVRDLSSLDLDMASEFLQMAATLLEIKSRALLPRPPRLEPDEEDPSDVLLRRLEEYKRVKEACEALRAREPEALAMLYRLPAELAVKQRVELQALSPQALQAAFLRLLQKPNGLAVPETATHRIEREVYTISRCTAELLLALHTQPWLRFLALFETDVSRDRLVSMFIALLELLRLGRVQLRQEGLYGEIWIGKAA